MGGRQGGRPAKPLALHVAEGNPNRLTKAEIERRGENQVRLGEKRFPVPDGIKNDMVAVKKWREMVALFDNPDVDFVSSSDLGMMEMHARTWSRYQAEDNKGEEADHVVLTKLLAALTAQADRLLLTPAAKIKNIPAKQKVPNVDEEAERMFG
jgi:hypothetical protein